jgi:MFS family permease
LARVLRNLAFRRLAVSYGVNEFGDNFGLVALAVLVFEETGSALATAALFVAAKFLPAGTAPWLTARLDRVAARLVLPALYAVEAGLFAALAWQATDFSLGAVLALAFLDGSVALTARALSRAVVAGIVESSEALRDANAVLNVFFAVTSAVGPAVAGVVVATQGASLALALDAVSFAVIAVLLSATRGLPAARREPSASWATRVRSGLDYARRNATVRALVSAQALAFIFFFLVIPIEVVYAERTLDAGSEGFGALLAAWGAGMIFGSALFARFRRRTTAFLVGTSTLLVGAGYLGMAAAPGIVLACLASALGGIGNGVQWVAVLTAVQEAVEHSFQARVVGLLESVGAAAPGVGYLLGGLLTSVWSPRVAYLVAGLGVVAVAFAMTRRLASGGGDARGRELDRGRGVV